MRVIIVGGGWSGLAAGIELSQHPCEIHILESAPSLGGRARSVNWQALTVDNGQHLMLGAYREMLALMQRIKLDPDALFSRQQINLSIFDALYEPLKISSSGIFPKPLNRLYHLWRSTDFSSLLAIRRLEITVAKNADLNPLTVSDLLEKTRQPTRLIRQLWEPLTLAMLNTPIHEASAAVFANVLNASLFADDSATELLLPKHPLGDVFPTPAAAYLSRNGVEITLNNRVQSLLLQNNRITGVVDQHGEQHEADAVILALPPSAIAKLLPEILPADSIRDYPICTVYLQYQPSHRPPASMTGFSGTLSQWLFDRSFQQPGLMSVVISGPGEHMRLTKAKLITAVSQELACMLPDWPAAPEDAWVIREKRATFACTPDVQNIRPLSQTSIENLWLAGDFVRHPFPATLETAISNGRSCARQLLKLGE